MVPRRAHCQVLNERDSEGQRNASSQSSRSHGASEVVAALRTFFAPHTALLWGVIVPSEGVQVVP